MPTKKKKAPKHVEPEPEVVETPTPDPAPVVTPAAEPTVTAEPAPLPETAVTEVATECDHHLLDEMWQDSDRAWWIRVKCTKCGYIGEPVPRSQATVRLMPPDFARF